MPVSVSWHTLLGELDDLPDGSTNSRASEPRLIWKTISYSLGGPRLSDETTIWLPILIRTIGKMERAYSARFFQTYIIQD